MQRMTMKSITKISGITIATLLTVTIVSMSLMESADAQRDRRDVNQDARNECDQRNAVIGACVGGINANVQALNDVTCSIFVLSRGC
jgi:hypothetical protein